MYGARLSQLWEGTNLDNVKAVWAEDLAGYSGIEIRTGIDACKVRPWPPTLPEFLLLCRPALDPQSSFYEAVEQMRIRLQGLGVDVWSNPKVYWAAVEIGSSDLNQIGWEQIKHRWSKVLEKAKSDPVTAFRKELPQPGYQSIDRNEAARRVELLANTLKCDANGSRAWAVRLARREASGDSLVNVCSHAWREALGFSARISVSSALELIDGGLVDVKQTFKRS